jgi:hypothetical protein
MPVEFVVSLHFSSVLDTLSRRTALRAPLVSGVLLLALTGCGEDDAKPADITQTVDTVAGSDAAAGTDVMAVPDPVGNVAGDRAGIAVLDISPTVFETFTDKNNNGSFDGCPDDPTGTRKYCDEPFDDANGNGKFDTAFIAGFGGGRAASKVHDPITVRTLALVHGDRYLFLTSIDVVGLGGDHIQKAQAELAKLGYDPKRIIVSSTHTHEGPDVRGMWGSQMPGRIYSGANPEYNAKIRKAIVQSVVDATANLQPADLRIGAVKMRDQSPWFNGPGFGGQNPDESTHGLLNDIRDPVIVSDQVLAISAKGKDGKTIATMIGFSGHPELLGSDNTELSADYVHYLRERVKTKLGGETIFVAECLGGMMSGLGAPTPLVDEQGEWVWDEQDGKKTPKWAPSDSWDLARSYGTHVADAALKALGDGAESLPLADLDVQQVSFLAPPDNFELKLMVNIGLFDLDTSMAIRDATCPRYDSSDTAHPGCLTEYAWRVRVGPLDMLTAPGELFPELFWGMPTDDPRWESESKDVTKRGASRGSVFFPQHDADCDGLLWASQCSQEKEMGDCDCVSTHDAPYRYGPDATWEPPAKLMTGKYKFLVGNAGDHLGYIVPETDFHFAASQLAGGNGDHYEETVSLSFEMASIWRKAIASLLTK